ncbi:LOW QUALITY PROTEIN: pleckstrin homology domain-containing family H member 1 [Hippocampus comes]|uniref:LOW QUALITY PROTEIN: pleckstrin homology domain-containing family H member 1 n=1 Tax=Hippocampus comes TaxID=109280 RepID=UPI00094EEB78|nr:PREDICTED: LOW QUALITY PROTEIN: pleckstrin homology domain-containing family H member 1-like [Hippocampus comes]
MADVLEGGAAAGRVGASGVDWQKRCVALEMQLLRFRLQAGKIRELLAEKMQELEQRVIEADQRAESAEKQIHTMEEKLKSANVQSRGSESLLNRKYQDLSARVQEKDATIKRLEIQLEKQIVVRAQEAKIIEEKAAKIKDWVTIKLRELEQENQQLQEANGKQTQQIRLLQDKLQALLEKPVTYPAGSPVSSPRADVHPGPGSPPFPHSGRGTSPSSDDSRSPAVARGAAKNLPTDLKRSPELTRKGICKGCIPTPNPHSQGQSRKNPGPEPVSCSEGKDNSDKLNSKFGSQCLHSSSSSSSSSSAYEMAQAPPGSSKSPPRHAPQSSSVPRSPSTNNPFPRAESAEKQIHTMEEKLKSANVQSRGSESLLNRKYQDLSARVQEKDATIKRLEIQLEKQIVVRAQEAKIIEEKAAKIKDWVTIKLRELEQENQQLQEANGKQTQQIRLLQDKLQALLEKPVTYPAGSPVSSPRADVHPGPGSPPFPHSGRGTSPSSDDSRSPAVARGAAKNLPTDLKRSPELTRKGICKGCIPTPNPHSQGQSRKNPGPEPVSCSEGKDNSDKLNSKFGSQCLHSSSSSSSSSSAYEMAQAPPGSSKSPPRHAPQSSSVPRSPSTNNPFPNPAQAAAPQSGASLTLPKIRTPLTPRDSIQLVKKHFSQPQHSLDRLHQLVSIDIMTPLSTCSTLTASTSPFSQPVEETDIDDKFPDSMDGVVEGSGSEEPTQRDGLPLAGHSEELERLEADVPKPPTPPLHRFPSWESRIYAVAKAGMRVSESSPGARCPGRGSILPLCPAASPFAQLIYKNISVPVYTTLKGKATQISAVPLWDNDDSSSEDDSGSLASLRTSMLSPDKRGGVPGSPRAVKRGVSMSSISSESDYAIPPDACSLDSDYSEPEHKVQRTSSYSCESTGPETLEKCGYLLKMSSQVKAWKRRWFILRNGEILYYKSPFVILCKITLFKSTLHFFVLTYFQLVTEKKTFYLTADSPNILEEWIRVLQNILKVQASSPVSVEPTSAKPTVTGWLTKVKHGHSKLVWCRLVGKVFYYYRNQEDKLPLGQLQLRSASVQEVDRSCDSDEDYEAGVRGGFLSSHCTLVLKPANQSPSYLLVGTKQETDAWLYHLCVAAGSGGNLKVGTECEQLIGKLLDADGDAECSLWQSDALSFSKEGLRSPLTTLPSDALQTEALKLFKSCQLFINVLVESPCVDYHTSLAQNALQVCLSHPELHNEMYCQLIKQTNRRTPHNYSVTQCWQLLSLCVALFLPQQHFLWYLRQHLRRNAEPSSDVGKYAVYCQRSLERTLHNGEREAKPSRMEIVSILLRNPYHHSLPFSIPVHFMNNTYQVVGFDGSTTVEEFLNTLNQRIGMRSPQLSGFALFTDDPSGKDLEHCLLPTAKICDVISKWEQALKEQHPGKNEGTRIVRLTYKNRLCFRSQVKGETERERLLLAHQVNDNVQQGHFPVNKELALEVAALMAQVEHGDLERTAAAPPSASTPASPQPKSQLLLLQALERFYPKRYKHNCSAEQLRELSERLSARWSMLRGCSAAECVRIYLTVARGWTLFGAKLFSVKAVPPAPHEQGPAWLAVNEDGLCVLDYAMHTLASYSYQSVVTFGGCCDDFLLVASQQTESGCGKKSVEKLLFAMAKPKILELTLLMASYMNHWTPGAPPNTSQEPQAHWDANTRHFPTMNYTTKVPTLL